MKRVLWMLALVVLLLLTPMLRRRAPVSSRFVAGAAGLDRADGRWQLSVQQLTDADKVLFLSGETVADAAARAVETAGQDLEWRQNRLLCIGESAAKAYRLSVLTDYLVRTENGRLTTDVMLCRGEAATLLKTAEAARLLDLSERAPVFAQGLRTRLLDICRTLADGGDAVIPIVRVEGDTVQMDGAALYVGDRWMTDLTVSQTAGLSWLQNQAEAYTVTVGTGTVELTDLYRSFSVTNRDGHWQITASLRANAAICEQTDRPVDTTAIEQAVAEDVGQALRITAKTFGSDLCGLWDAIQTELPFTSSWSHDEGKRQLQSSEYIVRVSVRMGETGTR